MKRAKRLNPITRARVSLPLPKGEPGNKRSRMTVDQVTRCVEAARQEGRNEGCRAGFDQGEQIATKREQQRRIDNLRQMLDHNTLNVAFPVWWVINPTEPGKQRVLTYGDLWAAISEIDELREKVASMTNKIVSAESEVNQKTAPRYFGDGVSRA